MYIKKDVFTHQKRCMYIKRDIVASKEVYTHEKRCTYIKRDVCTSREMYVHQERCTYIKRDVCTSKEAQSRDPNKETLKKDLHKSGGTRRLNRESSTERVTSKEVYTHQKRCVYIKSDVNSTERALSLLSRRFPPDLSLSLFLSVSVSLSLC